MNIVLCTDNRYVNACGVCITSILETNKDINISIFILTEGIENKYKKKFQQTASKYNVPINVITLESSMFRHLKISNRFPKSIYFRFLIPDILNDQAKALYLDCDIIVNGSLSYLEDIELSNYACAAVLDQMSDMVQLHNRLSLPMNKDYFNSGVLLMNLDYWRNHKISEKLTSFIYENSNICRYPDQDALNIILMNKVFFLPLTYNFQQLFYNESKKLLLFNHRWPEINMTKDNPIIIHYTFTEKPWHKDCVHPQKGLFDVFSKKSFFYTKKTFRYGIIKRIMLNFVKKYSYLFR